MTLEEKSTIQRKLGNIEAVAICTADDTVSALLIDAVEVIDGIIDKEEGVDIVNQSDF